MIDIYNDLGTNYGQDLDNTKKEIYMTLTFVFIFQKLVLMNLRKY